MWQQLEFTSDLEFDPWDTLDWGGKWPDDFDAGEIQFVSYDLSNNTNAIDVRKNDCVFEEDSSFKMSRAVFLS